MGSSKGTGASGKGAFTRRGALVGGAALVAAPMVIGSARAAAEVTWKVQSHWPKASASYGDSLAIIAEELKENTGGRFELQLFGAGQRQLCAIGALARGALVPSDDGDRHIRSRRGAHRRIDPCARAVGLVPTQRELWVRGEG